MVKSMAKKRRRSASDSWFQHVAQEIPGENAKTEWCEAVSDEDYGKLDQEEV